MYQTVADIMNEDDTLEIWIKDGFPNDKSIWWRLNIDFTTIIWQQEVKTNAKRINRLSTDVERSVSNLKDRSFEQ